MSITRIPLPYHNHTHIETIQKPPPEITSEYISREHIIELFNANNRTEILKLICVCNKCELNSRCTNCKINSHYQPSYYVAHLVNYCLINNDIDFLNQIFIKHNSLQYNWYCSAIIKIISSSNSVIHDLFFQKECKMIDIQRIFYTAIDTNNINALKLLLEYGHKLMNFNQIIFSGYIDIIQYAKSFEYNLQDIFDTYDFSCDASPDTWMDFDGYASVAEFKILMEVGIDLSKQINNIMLYRGASINNLDLVKFCVELGATNFNECLDSACMENYLEMVVYFLDIGADVTSIDDNSVLYLEYDIAVILLKHNYIFPMDSLNVIFVREFSDGDDINKLMYIFNIIGSFDYFFLLENKYIATSNCHIDKNGRIDSQQVDEYFEASNLEYVVSKNKLSHVKFVVEYAFDQLLPELNRLFIIAISNGHIDMVLYLLDLGADISFHNNLAILCAIFFGHCPMLKILIEYGMKLEDMLPHNLFMMGAYGSSIPEYQIIGYEILTTRNDIFRNNWFNFGSTYLDIFKLLIDYNISAPDYKFIEVLDIKYYNVNLFAYLIQNNLDINTKLNIVIKNIPYCLKYLLERAIVANFISVVELLLENGANVNIPELILCTKNDQITKLLLEYRADI